MINDPKFYDALEAHLPSPDTLKVLDAGCGARFPFQLNYNSHITGIDISSESMNRSDHLHEYIVGDIQNHKFESEFDLITCMNVLEHVPNPRNAIENLALATRSGGMIVLGFPNPLSLKGLVTKFTPHSFHVFFLKKVLGYSKAGQKGYAPFPTHLKFSLATNSVTNQLKNNGFDILFIKEFEGNQPKKLKAKFYTLYLLYTLFCQSSRMLSLGSLKLDLSETLIIAQRQ